MSKPEQWRRRQLETAQQLLDEHQFALRHGDLRSASDAVDEALVILEMARAEGVDDDLRRLEARAFNDRGLLYQRTDQREQARPLHRRAAEIVDEVDSFDDEFAATAATVYLNLGQIALFDQDFDAARQVNERAVDIVRDLRERGVEGTGPLALSIFQNETAVESYEQNFEKAESVAEEAVELAEELALSDSPSALGQAARICQQLSVQLFEADHEERALEWGRRAEQLSERTYEHVGDPALQLYIVSQINLISYYEQMRQYADAEDCLWKAIDVAGPDPEILQRGEHFYQECRKQADSRLEAGNLPRDEVEMGYEELTDLMDEAGVGST